MDLINYNKTFYIRCENFEDRKDIYERFLFRGDRTVYESDYRDYDSASDYNDYPHIKWNENEKYYIASDIGGYVGDDEVISSRDFRTLNGHNINEYRSKGCGSRIRFKFV